VQAMSPRGDQAAPPNIPFLNVNDGKQIGKIKTLLYQLMPYWVQVNFRPLSLLQQTAPKQKNKIQLLRLSNAQFQTKRCSFIF
jgi:hypothetical protein